MQVISSISVDNFHPAPEAIARLAKTLSYEEREYEGHSYKGIGTGYKPEGAAELLSSILGSREVTIDMEYFRLGVGDDLTNYIHADSGISKLAAVWYLTEAPAGTVAGTAFWKHREMGIDSVPDISWIEKNFKSVDEFIQKLRDDNADESKWEMTGLVGQKFNRIAIYPTTRFHSRYPQKAWGKDVTDGRICWTAFFRTT